MDTMERTEPKAPSSLVSTISLIGMLSMLALAAVGGGLAMILDPTGSSLGLEPWRSYIPFFADFFVPGWLLLVLQGIVPIWLVVGLTTGIEMPFMGAVERRIGFAWPWVGSVAEGVGVIAWVILQFFVIPETAPVQFVVLAMGAAILALAFTAEVRARYALRPPA
jgi:hypothetical protein